jgi:hypothetical protein
VKDLVDAVRDDVWSWRTLGEVAMVLPYGRVGKIGKIDDAIDAMDDLRDADRAADDLRDVTQAADEIEDTRSVVKIGGPSEFDPKSLHGMSGDDVRASIPANWEVKPTRSGGGTIFKDPTHHGRQIRIMPGYPAGSRPDPVTTGPYAVVSQNGEPVKIPLAGNPTLGQP